jgi:transcriptional regulator with XRE-family HTH domain
MSKPEVSEAQALHRKITSVLLQGTRLKAGKSKKECAEALGVTVGIYAAYETGRRDLSLPELEFLAHFLKVPIADFFENQERLVNEEPPLPREQVVELRQRIIGALLRKARTEKNLSHKDMAELLGVSPHTITQYEFGQKPIPLSNLQEVADALELPMSYFVDEGFGTLGEEELIRNQFARFGELPDDVRRFVINPSNISYIRVGQRLSDMTVGQLRNIAASLLDITY